MINLEIAEKFRLGSGFANIYGFILFSDSHANVIKVLRDNDYWNGFNADSNGWIVFSIKPKQGRTEFPKFPKGMMGMMISIWKEPRENLKLLELFDMQDSRNLPCFIAFAIDKDQNVKKVFYPISDDSVDNARNSIQKAIKIITNRVDEILPEYKQSENVFREVKSEVESQIAWTNLKKNVEFISWIKGLIM